MLQRFSQFILQGRTQAMAIAFICSFIPLIGVLGILIAGLVTLRKGAFEGALVLFAATFAFALSYAIEPTVMNAMAMIALAVVLLSNAMTWGLAVILRQTRGWNITLEAMTLMGAFAVIVIHVLYPNIEHWWEMQLNAYFTQVASMVDTVSTEAMTKEAQALLVNQGKLYATGLITVSILLNAFIQLVIARWWESALFFPGRLRDELYSIRASRVLTMVFMLALIFAFLGNAIARDVMTILYVVLCLAGLSLLHCLLATRRAAWFGLLLLYAGVVIVFPWSILILALCAVLDTWIDVRKRFNRLT